MSYDLRTHTVIHSLYAAGKDDALWPEALEKLCDFTKSQGAIFWVLDGVRKNHPTFTVFNFDAAYIDQYVQTMFVHDPVARYVSENPRRDIVHDGMVISETGKACNDYYNWEYRIGQTWHRLVGQVHPIDGVQAGISLCRTRQAGQFNAEDVEKFASDSTGFRGKIPSH